MMTTEASAQAGGSAPISAIGGSVPQTFSKLTARQLAEKIKSRVYLSEDIARTKDFNPLYPYNAYPSYFFIGYEYFPSAVMSLGVLVQYTQEKDKYVYQNAYTTSKSSGIYPYVSYLMTRNWLVTGQVGFAVQDYNTVQQMSTGGKYRIRRQVMQPFVGGFVTWIGPEQPITASVRGGLTYDNQRYRSAIDNLSGFFPARHFENITASLSTRLKYKPAGAIWDAFLQIEVDNRIISTHRPAIWRPDSGVQNMFYQFGPGTHIKINDRWEVRFWYLRGIGFGYAREDRVGVRLRAAI
jgi:hypothetical protein